MKEAVIIFVRNPELGKVKTRLAKELGDQNTLNIYIKLLEHTQVVSAAVSADKFVFGTEQLKFSWPGSTTEIQSSGDLGEKMNDAFQLLFERGYQKVVIIGSDCLQLSTHHIEEAFTALNENDIVIGPAEDGGYYLLGMKKIYSKLFMNKSWSTEKVFTETLQSIQTLHLRSHILEQLVDVDEKKDLPAEWRWEYD